MVLLPISACWDLDCLCLVIVEFGRLRVLMIRGVGVGLGGYMSGF